MDKPGPLMAALVLLASHAMVFGAGFYYKHRTDSRTALVVNGQAASKRDLDEVLVLFREDALKLLATDRIIRQEAQRLGLTVTDKEVFSKDLEDLDPALRQAMFNTRQVERLFHKVVLNDSSEQERRQIYDSFKEQLKTYKLSYIFVSRGADMQRMQVDLEAKAPWNTLNSRYGSVPPQGFNPNIYQKRVASEALRELVGAHGLSAIRRLKPGQFTGPLPSAVGSLLIRLESADETYEGAKSTIEDLIFQSRRNLYTYELGIDSAVSSPLPVPRAKRVSAPLPVNPEGKLPAPTPKVSAPVLTLPAPTAAPQTPSGLTLPPPTGTPAIAQPPSEPLHSLPKPISTPTYVPQELPKPLGRPTPVL
jgi:hypothetical protein